jgi:multidrug efflux pump subunit AcrB
VFRGRLSRERLRSSRTHTRLLISNRPFGFVALLGLIALAGMIMHNRSWSIRLIATSRQATAVTARSSTRRYGVRVR